MIFAATIFLSAFLLFQVQPIVGRVLLPWYGGSIGVWTTCMLFFQVLLLGGYGYSHLVASRLSPKRQVQVHSAVLLAAGATVIALCFLWGSPLTPPASWKPADGMDPVSHILVQLAVSVGLPYFTVSTTGPLVQAWFNLTPSKTSAYRLYALSNAGSLIALITYPILIEPILPVRVQALMWSVGYVAFVALTVVCGRAAASAPAAAAPVTQAAVSTDDAAPSVLRRLVWFLLAATASTLLLATTNVLCQDLAVVPFLWVLPLCLYLASFILTFDSPRWYRRNVYLPVFAVGSVLVGLLLYNVSDRFVLEITSLCVVLFTGCMLCHGELVRLKPAGRHLTNFYLMMSAGGAAGGLFVGLVAPALFATFREYALGILSCWILMLGILRTDPSTKWGKGKLFPVAAPIGMCLLGALLLTDAHDPKNDLLTRRNFYGAVRIAKEELKDSGEPIVRVMHGTTVHGFQSLLAENRDEPTSYYCRHGGVGLAIAQMQQSMPTMKVGVIGLGAGTLAAYGRPGDTYRFYEIDPKMMDIASGEGGHFSFLKDSKAKVELVLGDARISLDRERAQGQSQGFDLLVLDAFSGDAVPMHLLTKEAFELYVSHLKPNGVIAAHISNRYLGLRPVVYGNAEALGLKIADIFYLRSGGLELASQWELLTRGDLTENKAIALTAKKRKPAKTLLWTDDHSNLFQVVRLEDDDDD